MAAQPRSLAGGRALAVLAVLGLILVLAPAQDKAQARLLRGPIALRGLPFFGTNALPALQGEYGVGAETLRVWSCRAPLVFGADWKSLGRDEGGGPALRIRGAGQGVVLALSSDAYSLFVEAAEDSPGLRRFALSLERRFRSFFLNAPTDAELSFPAFVDLAP